MAFAAGIERLVARTHRENVASAALLARLGFQPVGLVELAEGQRLEFVLRRTGSRPDS